MALSSKILHILLALLVGVYLVINLSGFHHHNQEENENKAEESLRAADMVRKAQVEMKLWKGKAGQIENDYAGAMKKIHELEGTLEDFHHQQKEDDHHAGEKPQEEAPKNPNEHPVCQQLSYPTPSTFALWNHEILSI